MEDFTRPKRRKPPPRDALARTVASMPALGAFVNEVRAGLAIRQSELADRAGVSRQWLVALEQGRQSLEAGKVLRTLEALGFEIVLTPYIPPPPWMLRPPAPPTPRGRATPRAAACGATRGGRWPGWSAWRRTLRGGVVDVE